MHAGAWREFSGQDAFAQMKGDFRRTGGGSKLHGGIMDKFLSECQSACLTFGVNSPKMYPK